MWWTGPVGELGGRGGCIRCVEAPWPVLGVFAARGEGGWGRTPGALRGRGPVGVRGGRR